MNSINKIKLSFTVIIMILFTVTIGLVIQSKSSAVSGNQWNASRIIDDSLFYDSTTMSVSDIQAFLNSKMPSCDTNGTQPSEYGGGTRAQYAASVGWHGPPYVCLRDYYQVPDSNQNTNNLNTNIVPPGAISAAQIIKNASDAYNISPKALITTLQKESPGPLLTDSWPLASQYRNAMGYGCPDTAPCDVKYEGFYNQMMNAAWQFKYYKDNPNSFRYKPFQNNTIDYRALTPSCGSSVVYIENYATAGLYNYTPYQPNAAALSNIYGSGDSCSSYGNRNFWRLYNDWFGSTYSTYYNGVDYFGVFDSEYYLDKYSDLKSAFGSSANSALIHFVNHGMREGRQAIESFNVFSYKNRYPDLRAVFGNNLQAYYMHYIRYGKSEGRIATGSEFNGVSFLNGINYSAVYNFNTYITTNPDIKTAFGNNDVAALIHFATYGMQEGRQAIDSFNVISYKNRYPDLRAVFGNNLQAYYMHYIRYGKSEGRIATGSEFNGVSFLNGINYSAVYNFNTYITTNPDIKTAFGNNDVAALIHFATYGMQEGRQAIDSFNVISYKNRYPDLRAVFGNNLQAYYMHYIRYGKSEGRIAI